MKNSISCGIYTFLVLVMTICVLSCSGEQIKGSGKPATRKLELNGVKKISIKGTGNLLITQAEEENLLIKADDNILPYIISQIKNDELVLAIDNVSINPVTPLVFSVNIKDVSQIESFGSTKIEIKSLKTKHLNIDLNGSATIKASINVDEINIATKGSSKAILDGSAHNQSFVLRGSSTLDGTNLIGKRAALDASGSASINLNVTEKISGSISGAVKSRYKNNPIIELKTFGASTIKRF